MKKNIRSTPKGNSIRSVILFYNEEKPEMARWVQKVKGLFEAKGVRVLLEGGSRKNKRLPSADLAVAMGGDGTMLRVARALAPQSIPLVGINMGGLGFLSATDASELEANIDEIISGRFTLEERWMLSVEVFSGTRRLFGPQIALNDCVIRCGENIRAISLQASCANNFVAEYFGDGLIIATPTGSTAYALAAGGPVVDPRLDTCLIVPICAHTLTQRSLLVPAKDLICIRSVRRNQNDTPQTVVSLDGQVGCRLPLNGEVRISRYKKPFHLLVNPNRSYFEVLRSKLKWGAR